jgi:hypothetical protein
MDEITYTITHNIFKKTNKENFYLNLELALYDQDMAYLDTITLDNLDNPKKKYSKYFSARYDVFDKELKYPDDVCLSMKLHDLA